MGPTGKGYCSILGDSTNLWVMEENRNSMASTCWNDWGGKVSSTDKHHIYSISVQVEELDVVCWLRSCQPLTLKEHGAYRSGAFVSPIVASRISVNSWYTEFWVDRHLTERKEIAYWEYKSLWAKDPSRVPIISHPVRFLVRKYWKSLNRPGVLSSIFCGTDMLR